MSLGVSEEIKYEFNYLDGHSFFTKINLIDFKDKIDCFDEFSLLTIQTGMFYTRR